MSLGVMKKYLFLPALVAIALAGCTSSEVIEEGIQGNAIGFTNVVDKSTRAVGGNLDNTSFTNFMIYGYYVKPSTNTPIQIFNGVNVHKSTVGGKTTWSYDDERWWVPGCTYYFYAYSCADIALVTGKGSPVLTLTNETTVDGRALAILSYRCDGTHQHDLVTAENENIVAKDKDNPEVGMQFNHALCKIKAVFTTDLPKEYKVKVTNVKIDEYYNVADFNVGTNTWSMFSPQEKPYTTLEVDDNKNIMSNMQGSSVETSEIFMIPKKYENTEFVKLHFSVQVTKDGEEILQRNITGTWSPQWQPARIYTYNINITGNVAGIEPIVFAAEQSLGSSAWDSTNEVKMEFGVDTN